eukprot:CAMPEP_0194311314 /NCGR_PEP_ID=MMETSP0171-20130528/8280_1 /TAXON_ID=218684 /ORGANISM="Corethron pennatum, Strain L29A3" /LENGTH=1645 /DNA_ID=CAMNT_0039065349 /DNA_START=32 /DNA_END=4969 /DNA_ORIENTATION=-
MSDSIEDPNSEVEFVGSETDSNNVEDDEDTETDDDSDEEETASYDSTVEDLSHYSVTADTSIEASFDDQDDDSRTLNQESIEFLDDDSVIEVVDASHKSAAEDNIADASFISDLSHTSKVEDDTSIEASFDDQGEDSRTSNQENIEFLDDDSDVEVVDASHKSATEDNISDASFISDLSHTSEVEDNCTETSFSADESHTSNQDWTENSVVSSLVDKRERMVKKTHQSIDEGGKKNECEPNLSLSGDDQSDDSHRDQESIAFLDDESDGEIFEASHKSATEDKPNRSHNDFHNNSSSTITVSICDLVENDNSPEETDNNVIDDENDYTDNSESEDGAVNISSNIIELFHEDSIKNNKGQIDGLETRFRTNFSLTESSQSKNKHNTDYSSADNTQLSSDKEANLYGSDLENDCLAFRQPATFTPKHSVLTRSALTDVKNLKIRNSRASREIASEPRMRSQKTYAERVLAQLAAEENGVGRDLVKDNSDKTQNLSNPKDLGDSLNQRKMAGYEQNDPTKIIGDVNSLQSHFRNLNVNNDDHGLSVCAGVKDDRESYKEQLDIGEGFMVRDNGHLKLGSFDNVGNTDRINSQASHLMLDADDITSSGDESSSSISTRDRVSDAETDCQGRTFSPAVTIPEKDFAEIHETSPMNNQQTIKEPSEKVDTHDTFCEFHGSDCSIGDTESSDEDSQYEEALRFEESLMTGQNENGKEDDNGKSFNEELQFEEALRFEEGLLSNKKSQTPNSYRCHSDESISCEDEKDKTNQTPNSWRCNSDESISCEDEKEKKKGAVNNIIDTDNDDEFSFQSESFNSGDSSYSQLSVYSSEESASDGWLTSSSESEEKPRKRNGRRNEKKNVDSNFFSEEKDEKYDDNFDFSSFYPWTHDEERDEFILDDENDENPSIRIPRIVFLKLFQHQREGIAWMAQRFKSGIGGILGDDMGMGKTLQAVTLLSGLMKTREIKKALIVCPVSLLTNWNKEAVQVMRLCAPKGKVTIFDSTIPKIKRTRILREILTSKNPELVITTYGLVNQDIIPTGFQGEELHWDIMLLDEGHKIKNPSTKIHQLVHMVAKDKTARFLLTGTPIMNNLKELWALTDWCTSGQVFGSYKSFQQTFARPIEEGRHKDASPRACEIADEVNTNLQNLLKPYLVQRFKDNVFAEKLPSYQDFVIFTELSKLQRKVYEEYLDSMVVKNAIAGGEFVLEAITRLKKICAHPSLVEKRQVNENDRRKSFVPEEFLSSEALINQSAKLDALVDLLFKLKEGKYRTLIFSQSTRMLDIIERVLEENSFSLSRIDGSVKGKERQVIVDDFNHKESCIDVMLLSTKVGGYGLTINGASRCIIYDPSWNPAEDLQAVARCYRIGQTLPVEVYRLIAAGTVEEKMYEMQVDKDGLRLAVQKSGETKRLFTKTNRKKLFELGLPGECGILKKIEDGNAILLDHAVLGSVKGIVGFASHDQIYKHKVETSSGNFENSTMICTFDETKDKKVILGRAQKALQNCNNQESKKVFVDMTNSSNNEKGNKHDDLIPDSKKVFVDMTNNRNNEKSSKNEVLIPLGKHNSGASWKKKTNSQENNERLISSEHLTISRDNFPTVQKKLVSLQNENKLEQKVEILMSVLETKSAPKIEKIHLLRDMAETANELSWFPKS